MSETEYMHQTEYVYQNYRKMKAERDQLKQALSAAEHRAFQFHKLLNDLGDYLDGIEIDFFQFEWPDSDPRQDWENWKAVYARTMTQERQRRRELTQPAEPAPASARPIMTLREAAQKIVEYRRHISPLNFQLEKLDDFINFLDLALSTEKDGSHE